MADTERDFAIDRMYEEQETEATFGFIVTDSLDEQLAWSPDLAVAVQKAVDMLEDDPELGGLDVYEVIDDGGSWFHARHITSEPNKYFDSVVVVLHPGEKIANPFGNQTSMTEEEINDVYADDIGKREAMLRDLR